MPYFDLLKTLLSVLDRFKGWIGAGFAYFTGKKVQRLETDSKQQRAANENVKKKLKEINDYEDITLADWDRIRGDISRVRAHNPASIRTVEPPKGKVPK